MTRSTSIDTLMSIEEAFEEVLAYASSSNQQAEHLATQFKIDRSKINVTYELDFKTGRPYFHVMIKSTQKYSRVDIPDNVWMNDAALANSLLSFSYANERRKAHQIYQGVDRRSHESNK